jgi:hypothetical protein
MSHMGQPRLIRDVRVRTACRFRTANSDYVAQFGSSPIAAISGWRFESCRIFWDVALDIDEQGEDPRRCAKRRCVLHCFHSQARFSA